MKPKVTVTMPAYNAERFIGEAIESVLEQDYNDFELLIIDDGSTDDTAQVIKSYAEKEQKIRWFRRKKNHGIGPTRNQLVKLAQGKYISICDADDKILPGKLKKHVKILDKYPPVIVVYGNILTIDKYGQSIKDPHLVSRDLNNWWDLLENPVMNNSATIRKSAILKVGGYDESTTATEDYDLWLKLSEIGKFKLLHESFAISRFYPESTSANNPDYKYKEDNIRVKKNTILRRYGKHLAGKFKW